MPKETDCLSAVLVIYFLAKSINPTPPDTDHSYACTRQPILSVQHFDPGYLKTSENTYFEINPKYADDITWASTAKHRIKHIKETTPRILEKRNMLINNTNTEDYDITRNGDDQWKTCKLLGR